MWLFRGGTSEHSAVEFLYSETRTARRTHPDGRTEAETSHPQDTHLDDRRPVQDNGRCRRCGEGVPFRSVTFEETHGFRNVKAPRTAPASLVCLTVRSAAPAPADQEACSAQHEREVNRWIGQVGELEVRQCD